MAKLILYIPLILSLMALSSCDKGSKEAISNQNSVRLFSESISYNLDSLISDIDKVNIFTISDEEVICLKSEKEILVLSFPEFEIIRKINVDFQIDGIGQYKNNIAVLGFESNTINLYDVYNSKKDKDVVLPKDDNYVLYAFNTKIETHNNLILLNKVRKVKLPEYFQTECLYMFDAKSEKKYEFGFFPDVYKNDDIFLDLYPIATFLENKIICSFNPTDSLYLFDAEGKLINSVSMKSKYFKNISPPDQEQVLNPRYYEKYFITNALYSDIQYDEYNELIYRTVLQATPYINSFGMKNSLYKSAFSIQIIDKNFSMLEELYLPTGSYDFSFTNVSSLGLVLVNYEQKNNVLNLSIIRVNDV